MTDSVARVLALEALKGGSGGGGSSGTTNYNALQNRPQINGVTLSGNKTTAQLGINATKDYTELQNIPTLNGHSIVGTLTSSDLEINQYSAMIGKPSINNVTLNGNLSLSDLGITSVTVDSALSATSTNPVENKAVTAALSTKLTDTDLNPLRTDIQANTTAIAALETSTTSRLAAKVDKVTGKDLSTNDFTNAYQTKLDGIETGANKTVVDADLSATSTNPVQNKAVYAALSDKLEDADLDDLKSDIQANSEAIDVLNGTGDGSVQKQIATALANISTLTKQIVTVLPTVADAQDNVIYLLAAETSGVYEQYTIVTDSDGNKILALLGSTQVDLTDYYNKTQIDSLLTDKVDKVTGKDLSTNDFTNADKSKLDGIENGANKTQVDDTLSGTSENPVQNKVIVSALADKLETSDLDDLKTDIQTNADNISDLSDDLTAGLDEKVDKVTGKTLTSNDFTDALKAKLDSIEDGADKSVVDSALSSTSENPVQNKSVYEALEGKQAVLTFDTAPTENSTNPVTSEGIYQALQNISVDKATVAATGVVKPDGTTITIDSDGTISTTEYTAGNGIDISDGEISAETRVFNGTMAEWNAKSTAEKIKYTNASISDDAETAQTTDTVESGNMLAVTSNAVYGSVSPLESMLNAIFNPTKRSIGGGIRKFLDTSTSHTMTATVTGAYQFMLYKHNHGNTAAIYVNNVAVCSSPFWGDSANSEILDQSDISWTPTIFVKKGDIIRIGSDNSPTSGTSRWFANSYNCWGIE